MQPMDLQGIFKYVAGRLFPRLTSAQGIAMLPAQPEGAGYYASDTDALVVKTQNPATAKEVLCSTKTGAATFECTGALAVKTSGAGTGASLSAVGVGSICSMVSDSTCTVRSNSAGVVAQGATTAELTGGTTAAVTAGTTATVTGGTGATVSATTGGTVVEAVAGSVDVKALAGGQDVTLAAEEVHCLPGTAGGGGLFLRTGTLAVLTADALTHVEGALVYVTDGRKFGEGGGAGTGLPGFWSAAGGGAFYDYAGNVVTA